MSPTTTEPRHAAATAPSTPGVSTTTRPRLGGAAGRVLENYALVFLTAIVFVFFSVFPASSQAFPTMSNLNVILGSQSVVALIAISALFAFVPGHFDFSLGAVAVTSQVVSAGLMAKA